MSWIYSDIIHRGWACASFSEKVVTVEFSLAPELTKIYVGWVHIYLSLCLLRRLSPLFHCCRRSVTLKPQLKNKFPFKSFTQKETWSHFSARQMEANTEGYLQRSMDSDECCNFKQGESCVIYKERQLGGGLYWVIWALLLIMWLHSVFLRL